MAKKKTPDSKTQDLKTSDASSARAFEKHESAEGSLQSSVASSQQGDPQLKTEERETGNSSEAASPELKSDKLKSDKLGSATWIKWGDGKHVPRNCEMYVASKTLGARSIAINDGGNALLTARGMRLSWVPTHYLLFPADLPDD